MLAAESDIVIIVGDDVYESVSVAVLLRLTHITSLLDIEFCTELLDHLKLLDDAASQISFFECLFKVVD